jgi:hypothetical protein
MEQKDIAEMIKVCFRKPKENETPTRLSSNQLLKLIQREYPTIQSNHSTKVHLGFAMKEMGYEHTLHCNKSYYKVIPLKA